MRRGVRNAGKGPLLTAKNKKNPYCLKCAGFPVKEYEVDLCEAHYEEQFEAQKQKGEGYCFQCCPDGEYTIKDVCKNCKQLNRKWDKEAGIK